MEESSANWPLHTLLQKDGYEDDDFFEHCDAEDDGVLREILEQPAFSSESESQSRSHSFHLQNNLTATEGCSLSLSSDEKMGAGLQSQRPGPENLQEGKSNTNSCDSNIESQSQSAPKRPRRSSSPRTLILSFDNSTVIPETLEPYPCYQQLGVDDGTRTRSPSATNSPFSSNRTLHLENQNLEPKPRANQGGKKIRSDSQTQDHIMAERKRRRELTERFIALSATIPGLKKTDKAYILGEAITYVKQLQERVRELEKQNDGRGAGELVICLEKYDLCANEDATTLTSSETSSEDCCSELLPDVEARVLVLEKDVLIEIHCEKKNGIVLKLLEQLENLHLRVTGSSVLPFGNATLGITIVAQMRDEHGMKMDDLVRSLKQLLLKQGT